MADLLATITAPLAAQEFAVQQTALWPAEDPDPYFEEMLFRLGDGWIDTPLGSLASSPAVYTTFTNDGFVDITLHHEEPIRVIVALQEFKQMFACLGTRDEVTIEMYGDPEDGFVSEIRAHGDETTVRFEHLAGPSYVADVPEQMPDLFEDGRFQVQRETPAPTVIETTTDALERVVDAIEAIGGSAFPLVTDDGLVLDVARHNVFVEGPLDGHVVQGPPVHNIYGPAFAKAVRTFEGQIRLETEPGGPLAIVREIEGYDGRIVLSHV